MLTLTDVTKECLQLLYIGKSMQFREGDYLDGNEMQTVVLLLFLFTIDSDYLFNTCLVNGITIDDIPLEVAFYLSTSKHIMYTNAAITHACLYDVFIRFHLFDINKDDTTLLPRQLENLGDNQSHSDVQYGSFNPVCPEQDIDLPDKPPTPVQLDQAECPTSLNIIGLSYRVSCLDCSTIIINVRNSRWFQRHGWCIHCFRVFL